jgi:UDP-2-acetamido-3-amino-2,3-dideoxy-glucuronate N-acetyltransferase
MAGARIGEHCNICDHAFVETGATLGNRVTVKNGVMIWSGVTIEDDVFVGPGVVLTNDLTPRARFKKARDRLLTTTLRKGATIGAGATLLSGIEIGENAFVGAGSVVTRSVPPHVLVAGNPARAIGWACECGMRLGVALECSCGRKYRRDPRTRGLITEPGQGNSP